MLVVKLLMSHRLIVSDEVNGKIPRCYMSCEAIERRQTFWLDDDNKNIALKSCARRDSTLDA